MQVQSLDQDDPLEKCMATHFSITAWRIPRTEEPGGLLCNSPCDCKESDMTEHAPTDFTVKEFGGEAKLRK